jgi:hypothetical protein
MDIHFEKAEIIKRVEKIHDASLIQALKSLLDFGLSKQAESNAELEESIEKALKQSKSGDVKSHREAFSQIRSRHKA